MKKILSFGLMVLCLLMIVSCGNSKNGKVKLISLTGYAETQVLSKTKKLANTTSTMTNDAIDYQYLVVKETAQSIGLTITLDNPNDYHIFDFKLQCDDLNAKVKINDSYSLISDLKSINWKGDTNESYTISIQLTQNLENTVLTITNLYYSDRKTGDNTYAADLNNKGTFYVYKLDNGVSVNFIKNSYLDGNYSYSIAYTDSRIKNVNIVCNGIKYDYSSTITLASTTFKIDYSYELDDNVEYKQTTNYSLDVNNLFEIYCFIGPKSSVFQIKKNEISNSDTYNIAYYKNKILVDTFVLNDKEPHNYNFGNLAKTDRVSFIITFDGLIFNL